MTVGTCVLAVMSKVGWVTAAMLVVDGMYAEQSYGNLVACWEMA